MKLTVAERITLFDVLPKEGNFATLKLLRQLREALSFDEEENKALNMTTTVDEHGRGMITWNPEASLVKDIPIGEKMTDVVVEALKTLDKTGKLTEQHFTLYEKFIEGVTPIAEGTPLQ